MKRILIISVLIVSNLSSGCENGMEPGFSGSGTIEATEIMISAKMRGEIIQLDVREGDNVSSGQVLARIDTEQAELEREVTAAGIEEVEWNGKILKRELDAAEGSVKQATATLDNIEKNRTRIAGLFKDNAATEEQLDKLNTEYELAQSRLSAAKKQIDVLETRLGALDAARTKIDASLRLLDNRIADGLVTCPEDGTVIEKYTEEGETAAIGTPICTIADLSNVWLTVYIGEEDVGKVKLGGKAGIRIDSHPDKEFEGVVTWISSKAEFTPKNVQTKESRVDLVYAVKITIDNPEGIFKIGMPADAYIEGL